MTLTDWATAYIKHRDLFERKIARIEQKEQELLITHKDDSVHPCFVLDTLDEPILEKLGRIHIVTKNLKDNVAFVAKHWKEFSQHEGLKLIFANEARNEKWVLIPHGHAKIADPASLKTGLLAMHDAVPEG